MKIKLQGNKEEMGDRMLKKTWNKRVSSTWQHQEIKARKYHYNKSKKNTTKHGKNSAK
jgi:hypothetical protein